MKGIALKKWESTLNLCVHAQGYDVELIMKAPCNDNYPLGIHSSCIYGWVLAIMVLTMMFNFNSISQTTWSTCLLQVNDSVQILSCSTFENLTPGISTILWYCITFYEFLLVRYFSSILSIHRFWVVINREH